MISLKVVYIFEIHIREDSSFKILMFNLEVISHNELECQIWNMLIGSQCCSHY